MVKKISIVLPARCDVPRATTRRVDSPAIQQPAAGIRIRTGGALAIPGAEAAARPRDWRAAAARQK
jgi:hypothetical protein